MENNKQSEPRCTKLFTGSTGNGAYSGDEAISYFNWIGITSDQSKKVNTTKNKK